MTLEKDDLHTRIERVKATLAALRAGGHTDLGEALKLALQSEQAGHEDEAADVRTSAPSDIADPVAASAQEAMQTLQDFLSRTGRQAGAQESATASAASEREVRRLAAKSESGKLYIIVEYLKIVSLAAGAGIAGEGSSMRRLRLLDRRLVKQIDELTFEIIQTGEVIRLL